ncbi:hypothetical protein Dxin01_00076 [Deinococcus xinjiangensis]|uniref:Secreted protein n=1 Tax=Deinococcus xinjiangensis TaxID=457454 RepID=A0ABP9V527_9DEIO
MPLYSPVLALIRKSTVTAAMIASWLGVPMLRPKALCRPLLIYKAPKPSEAATPNTVAIMARTSISFPAGPSTR